MQNKECSDYVLRHPREGGDPDTIVSLFQSRENQNYDIIFSNG